jgi:hypothetical protein
VCVTSCALVEQLSAAEAENEELGLRVRHLEVRAM